MTTGVRRLPHALRPFLVLGGFVLVWWCLATGTAQATEGAHHDLGTTTKALARSADKVIPRPAAHHATRSHQSAAKVNHTVRRHAAPAVSTVNATVRNNPVAPAVRTATKTVHTVATPVIEKTHKVLKATPLGSSVAPKHAGSQSVENDLPQVDESSTLQGETSPTHTSGHLSAARSTVAHPGGAATGLVAPSTTTFPGQGDAASSSPLGQGRDHHALETSGSTAASSVQSGSGSGPGAGLCETWLIAIPDTTGTLNSAPAGRHGAGPAYPPSSSPD